MRFSIRSFSIPLTAAALGCATIAVAAAPVYIYNFDGYASLIRDRRTVPAELDMPLRKSDLIRVEPESSVDLTLFGRYGVRILGQSQCRIDDLSESDVDLYLASGAMLVHLKSKESSSRFVVDTPVATADFSPGQVSVKLFEVEGEKEPGCVFSVRKGRLSVYIKESSASVTVLEGHTLRLEPGDYLPPARPSTEEEAAFSNDARTVFIADA